MSTPFRALASPAAVTAPPAPLLTSTDSNLLNTPDISQFNTVNDIPADYFDNQRCIYGFVERVIDGDTIRVRHIPGYGLGLQSNPQPLQQKGIANVTLSIRVYGVDTPETGKNKRQVSMPFGEDAKQFTTDMVYHRVVKITLLRRDQYNRAVAVVETVPQGVFTASRDLSMELAANGLAELYTGGGAVYYDRRAELEAAILTAQRNKRGIWSLENRRSAAEFKRNQKQQARVGAEANTPSLVAVTGLQNQRQTTATPQPKLVLKHKSSLHPSNKENLMDAVVTGLEFVG